jgi:hypothetical protein
MEYILVKDRQQVILGPMPWRARYIQTELNDLVEAGEKSTQFTISQTENGYVDCQDGYELIPVTFIPINHDSTYQYLEGPFYTYEDNTAVGWYIIHDNDISLIKPLLKQVAKVERQRRQALGTTITINNIEYQVSTLDTELQKYTAAYTSIGEGSINWKFGDSFEALDASRLESVINAIRSYIQTQFDWEKSIHESIDAATNIDELKAITIVEPSPNHRVTGLYNAVGV